MLPRSFAPISSCCSFKMAFKGGGIVTCIACNGTFMGNQRVWKCTNKKCTKIECNTCARTRQIRQMEAEGQLDPKSAAATQVGGKDSLRTRLLSFRMALKRPANHFAIKKYKRKKKWERILAAMMPPTEKKEKPMTRKQKMKAGLLASATHTAEGKVRQRRRPGDLAPLVLNVANQAMEPIPVTTKDGISAYLRTERDLCKGSIRWTLSTMQRASFGPRVKAGPVVALEGWLRKRGKLLKRGEVKRVREEELRRVADSVKANEEEAMAARDRLCDGEDDEDEEDDEEDEEEKDDAEEEDEEDEEEEDEPAPPPPPKNKGGRPPRRPREEPEDVVEDDDDVLEGEDEAPLGDFEAEAAQALKRRAAQVSARRAEEERTQAKGQVQRVVNYLDNRDPLVLFGCPRAAFDQVMGGLAMADHLSEKCRDMLQVMVATSLVVPAAERCKEQTMVVGMLEQTLHQVLARLEVAAKTARAGAASAKGSKSVAMNNVGAAELAVVRAQEFLDAKKSTLLRAAASLEDAKRETAERQQAKEQTANDGQGPQLELRNFERTFKKYNVLLEGRWAKGSDVANLLKEMDPLWEKLSFEDSMAAALPRALGRRPADRGPFDRMLLDQTSERLQKQGAELKKMVRRNPAAEIERALEALARKIEAETKAQAAAVYAVDAAKVSLRVSCSTLKAARASFDNTGPDNMGKEEAALNSEAELDIFKAGALESFRRLRDRRAQGEQEGVQQEDDEAPLIDEEAEAEDMPHATHAEGAETQ